MSRKAVENLDTSTIGYIFVCCQINMWKMKIKTILCVNIMYFRNHLELSSIIKTNNGRGKMTDERFGLLVQKT